MAEKRVQRRLAAILAADVVGYSRMMREDETGTLAQLKVLRKEVFDPRIADHNGRIVKTTGDGVLVEFASAVDATECAIKVQRALARRNEDVPESSRIELRIGINLGDIIVDDADIYGDGVNVAARLEGLCDTGEVYVSAVVHDQVEGKIEAAFDDLGEHTVKNIDKPIRVYRVSSELRPAVATEVYKLFDRPALAVLPFENIGGDPEQEYFADGLTEDIITALSLWRSFPVIAHNSTFAYKGTSPDIRQVGKELGARYVVEGSVRKAGNRIRVTAQLINSETGHHIWAEHYDRELADIFDLQDEITLTVVGAMQPELGRAEQERAWRKPTGSLDAWDLYQRGMSQLWKAAKSDNEEAKGLLRRAIEIDPKFSPAHAYLASATVQETIRGLAIASADQMQEASTHADRAVELDETDATAHMAKGVVSPYLGEWELGKQELRRAIDLNPSFSEAYLFLGHLLVQDGHSREAIPALETTMRLSPNSPFGFAAMANLGRAHLHTEEFEEGKRWAEMSVRHSQAADMGYLVLLSCLGHLDLLDEANAFCRAYLRRRPSFTIADVSKRMPYRQPEDLALFSIGLRKAGLPE